MAEEGIYTHVCLRVFTLMYVCVYLHSCMFAFVLALMHVCMCIYMYVCNV